MDAPFVENRERVPVITHESRLGLLVRVEKVLDCPFWNGDIQESDDLLESRLLSRFDLFDVFLRL
jgi:hypothetical protein